MLPTSHISQLTGLHWYSINAIDKRRMQARADTFYSGNVRCLVMDAFALHKRHRYATASGMPNGRACFGWAKMTVVRPYALSSRLCLR